MNNDVVLELRPKNNEVLVYGKTLSTDASNYNGIKQAMELTVAHANTKCMQTLEKYKEQCLITSWPVLVCTLVLGFSLGILFCIFARKFSEEV